MIFYFYFIQKLFFSVFLKKKNLCLYAYWPWYNKTTAPMWRYYMYFIGFFLCYFYNVSWLYFSKYGLFSTFIFFFVFYKHYLHNLRPRVYGLWHKYMRAYYYRKLKSYDEIWEIRATALPQQYYDYYAYIWKYWHEMEERILLILSLRIIILGL